MKVSLVRHPRVAVPPGICFGRSDVALAEDPAAAAARLQALLPPSDRCVLASSPLTRCLALAERLHPVPRVEPRLAEIDFGEWEMRPFSDIARSLIDAWAADPFGFRPPGGETAAEMFARAVEAFRSLAASDLNLVVVAHGGPLRAIAAHLLGWPPRRALELDFAFAAVTYIETDAGGGRIIAFNQGS